MEKQPIFAIFVDDEQISYETELSVEESVFWLETIKAMLLKRVIGSEVENDE
jgi:hypothetical protein